MCFKIISSSDQISSLSCGFVISIIPRWFSWLTVIIGPYAVHWWLGCTWLSIHQVFGWYCRVHTPGWSCRWRQGKQWCVCVLGGVGVGVGKIQLMEINNKISRQYFSQLKWSQQQHLEILPFIIVFKDSFEFSHNIRLIRWIQQNKQKFRLRQGLNSSRLLNS